MLSDVQPGAAVNCADAPLGTVEQVLKDERSGQPTALLVRHGRADYLLRIPARLVAEAGPRSVRLAIRFDDVETAAAMADDLPAVPGDVQEDETTDKSPLAESVLGLQPGETPKGPATG